MPVSSPILAPIVALVAWTMVIWLWMYIRRIPAMAKAGVKPQDAAFPGSLNGLPAGARQAADNYNHLMEQPTIFYALVMILALGGYEQMDVTLAWSYVGLRVGRVCASACACA